MHLPLSIINRFLGPGHLAAITITIIIIDIVGVIVNGLVDGKRDKKCDQGTPNTNTAPMRLASCFLLRPLVLQQPVSCNRGKRVPALIWSWRVTTPSSLFVIESIMPRW